MKRFATSILSGLLAVCTAVAAHAQLSVVPESTTGSSNQTINVAMTLSNPASLPIDAFGFTLSYPNNLLTYQSVSVTGTLTQNWYVVAGAENTPGTVQVGGFHTTPVAGSGVLLRVTFLVKPNAVGSGIVSLTNFVDDLASATTLNATFQATGGAGLSGLLGDYYDASDFTGTLLQRVDPVVNFNWNTSAPDPSMGADFFTVRWTGWVNPLYTQSYTFYTVSDDGVRLWVNNQLVINEWHDQWATERSGTIALTAGSVVPIKLEFYEGDGLAECRLLWSSASQAKQTIPTERLFATLCSQGVGDVDASGVLGAGDVACAFDVYLANQVLTSGCNYPSTFCELVSADANCSGSVTPSDARAIEARVAAGLSPAPCFASPEPVPSPPYELGLVQNVVDDGGTLRLAVLVMVEDGAGLDAFGARLDFPAAQLQFNRVEPGFFTSGWNAVDGRLVTSGQLVFGGFDAFTTAPAGSVDVCRVYFDFLGAPGTVGGLTVSNFVDDFTGAVVTTITGVDAPPSAPHRLHQNHPNPFNPSTQIRYDVGDGGNVRVRIAVYDVQGRLVRVLVDEDRAPGSYLAAWDGRTDSGSEAASGVYFYAMRAGAFVESRRMVLLK